MDAERLVAEVARQGVTDPAVLEALRRVPREAFVPPERRDEAYVDAPLPIGEGQTISQPTVVGLMVQALQIRPGDRVLDVGTGSGYAAAVLAALRAEVHSIERLPWLAERARKVLAQGGWEVEVHVGDGSRGWPEAAPYRAILVSAAAEAVPLPLKHQLAPGGVLVLPVGRRGRQRLLRILRTEGGRFSEEDMGAVAFVPLVAGPVPPSPSDPPRRPAASPGAPDTPSDAGDGPTR